LQTNIKVAESTENYLINTPLQKNKDNYFTKKQLEYYLINYPYKEFKETSNLDFNVKK